MIGNIAPQNSWEGNRLGKITASKINSILTKPKDTKANISKGTLTYLTEKVTELATGTTRQVSTYATEWGNDNEPLAARWFLERYPDFEYLGKDSPKFFEYSDFSGGSPDGYSKAELLVAEIKCPENPANHTKYVNLNNQSELAKAEPDYYAQIHFNMMCVAKYIKVDYKEMKGMFLSYCPLYAGALEPLQFKAIEVLPDIILYDKIVEALPKAEDELATMYKRLLDMAEHHATPILLTGETINNTHVLITD